MKERDTYKLNIGNTIRKSFKSGPVIVIVVFYINFEIFIFNSYFLFFKINFANHNALIV